MSIPLIDDRLKYVGVSYLRSLNAKTLRELTDVVVIQVDEVPTAVIVPYSIYLEIQKVLWPSSLVPSLEEVFRGSVLAQEEDARAVDLSAEPNGGVDANPDMEHSTQQYAEPPAPAACEYCARGSKPWQKNGVWLHEGGVACGSPPPYTTVMDKLHETPAPILTGIGTDKTLRGEKFARVDDSQPPVFDDLEVLNVKERDPQVPLCAHCGQPNDKPLCTPCFVAGHRNGNCLKCAEVAQ